MDRVRWGMIGCGDVTEVKSGPAFQKAQRSTLVAVMRRDSERAREYAQRHGVPKWYDSAEALILDPEVDAVYVATPPAFHKEHTLAVARAGKPVYVEKPMGLTHAECEEMIAACERAGVPLFVAYYRRALPRFLKVKRLLEERAIGDVRFVAVTLYQKPSPINPADPPWRLRPEIAGGGLFYDLACHAIDLLMFLLGPIVEAQGFASNQAGQYRAEDIVTGAWRFASGVQGSGQWCFSAFADVDVVEIVGSAGLIRFSTFGPDPVAIVGPNGREEFSIEHPPHIQQPLIQAVVDELLGRGSCPSTGRSAAATNWVMDRLTEKSRP